MVGALQSVLKHSAISGNVWKSWSLQKQVFVVAIPSANAVLVAGDSAPPSEYEWVVGHDLIAIRRGAVPDSLRSLGILFAWQRQPGSAIVVPYMADSPVHGLVHEAFHAYQLRLWRKDRSFFPGSGEINFPDRSVRAVTLLLLHGEYLSLALAATDSLARLRAAQHALAARAALCEEVGPQECLDQRQLVSREGAAEYVAWRFRTLSGELDGRSALDSIQRRLDVVRDISSLRRAYFYHAGAAMLMLLDMLRDDEWQSIAERVDAETLLSEAIVARGFAAATTSKEYHLRMESAFKRAVRLAQHP